MSNTNLNTEAAEKPLEKPEEIFRPPDSNKIKKCDTFYFNPDAPRSYSENTSKEELVLEHVLEYER